jgi:hypothetical protein
VRPARVTPAAVGATLTLAAAMTLVAAMTLAAVPTLAAASRLGAAPTLAAASGPGARAKSFDGMVRDVPTGAHVRPRIVIPAGKLPYGGGRVLHSNRTHLIFWAPTGSGLAFDPGYTELIETFLSDVAADSHKTTNTYGLSGQYYDTTGPAAYDSTYGGAVLATDPLPPNGCTEPMTTGPGWTVCLTDAQLETEIEQVIGADHLPTTKHDIYFLVTPDGLGSCTDSTSSSCALGGMVTGYCGYHSETSSDILYAVIPFNAVPPHCQSGNSRPNSSNADPAISTISHEQNETVTDPDGNAWIDSQGEEEADLCLTSFGPSLGGSPGAEWNESIHGGHFFLQELWSNANGACEPRAKPDSVWFAPTEAPGQARSFSFTAHASDPEGQIISYQWSFGDGRTGHGRRVSHTFRRSGAVTVALRATDSWGNWAVTDRTVRISGR